MLNRSILWLFIILLSLFILNSCVFFKLNEQEFWARDDRNELYINYKGFTDINSPNVICSSIDGNQIYAGTSSGLYRFWREGEEGWLNFGDNIGALGNVSAIVVSANGKFLYAYDNGSIYWFRIRNDGGIDLGGSIPAAVNNLLILPDDGMHIYFADMSGIYWHSIDPDTGALKTPQNSIAVVDGVMYMAMSSDGRFMYVTHNASPKITWFERDFETGALKADQTKDYFQINDGITTFMNLAIPPDGRHLYAGVSVGPANAISLLRRNIFTGELSDYKFQYSGDYSFINFTEDGKQLLYIDLTNTFGWHERDYTTGNLINSNAYPDEGYSGSANWIIATPDGRSVYGSAQTGGSVSTGGIMFFQRNIPGYDGGY